MASATTGSTNAMDHGVGDRRAENLPPAVTPFSPAALDGSAASDAVQPLDIRAVVVPDGRGRRSAPTHSWPEVESKRFLAATPDRAIRADRASHVGACREWPSIESAIVVRER